MENLGLVMIISEVLSRIFKLYFVSQKKAPTNEEFIVQPKTTGTYL